MALPAIQVMYKAGVLCGVATGDNNNEVISVIGAQAGGIGIPYATIPGKDYKVHLEVWLAALKPDVVFVMTYGKRIPPSILKIPALGFINFHYGLLPEMRGADPIFESIRHQHKNAGITVHKMDEGFDTGDILMREEFQLPVEFTYGMLCGQMAQSGAKMCQTLIEKIIEGVIPEGYKQDESKAVYRPKIKKEQIAIRWAEMTSDEIIALVRSCNPIAMGVPATLNGWVFGVCDVTGIRFEGDSSAILPGTIVALDMQNGLVVNCKDGIGVRMDVINTAEGFFAGHKVSMWGITAGMIFS